MGFKGKNTFVVEVSEFPYFKKRSFHGYGTTVNKLNMTVLDSSEYLFIWLGISVEPICFQFHRLQGELVDPSALVVSILKGETTVKEAARKHGLTVAEVEE